MTERKREKKGFDDKFQFQMLIFESLFPTIFVCCTHDDVHRPSFGVQIHTKRQRNRHKESEQRVFGSKCIIACDSAAAAAATVKAVEERHEVGMDEHLQEKKSSNGRK